MDCEVTAIETAILVELPGSVAFLTIPWVAWPPEVPWVLWVLGVPCPPCWWFSCAMVAGPGRGEVKVRTTVDWTRA